MFPEVEMFCNPEDGERKQKIEIGFFSAQKY